jgi:hypothetical protein
MGGIAAGTPAPEIVVLDVTDEKAPVRLGNPFVFTDRSGTLAVEFEAPAAGGRFLVQRVTDAASLGEPTLAPTLPRTRDVLQGIYVAPAELHEALQPLLAIRGTGYALLDPEAAYHAFSNGQESPEGIRRAIAHLVGSALEAVDFPSVVLVGHATLDPRGYTGTATASQVPTYVDESIDTSFTIENPVDYPYGLLFGDDDLIDAQVSRLPARSAAELAHMVSRILAHEATAGTLAATARPGVFAFDTDLSIQLDRPLWRDLWLETGRPLREVSLSPDTDGSAERALLHGFFQEGPSGPAYVMYNGHGNNTLWATSQLLTANDVDALDTRSGYPLVTTYTCLNAYYAFPGSSVRCLAERWLLAPLGRGGIASFAPSGADFYNYQREMAVPVMELLASPDRPETIGELMTLARLQFAINRPDLMDTTRLYLLFGDAASPTTLPKDGWAAGE